MPLNKVIAFILCVTACTLVYSKGGAENAGLMSPVVDGKERVCLDCHRSPNIHTNEGILSSQALCFECHAKDSCKKTVGETPVSLQVKPESFEKNLHKYVACIHCHVDVARSPHHSKVGAQCMGCHPAHGEGGTINDPHLRVECQACHRTSKFVFLDREIDRVRLSGVDDKKMPISLTDHTLPDVEAKDFCQRCHYPQNQVGAVAAVLPSKSFLCILCHNAPLAMGHGMFWVAFLVAVVGLIAMVSFWFRGAMEGEGESLHKKITLSSEAVWSGIFSRRFFTILSTLVFDVFLQRRILKESVRRWSIHSLIYLAFLGRLFLSILTLIIYNIAPDSDSAMALIDKNHWFVALVNDLLGLCIVLGILWAAIQRFVVRPPHVLSEEQDNIALIIVGFLVVTGFVLEGTRILVTQVPAQVAVYSFAGYLISKLLSLFPFNWQGVYGYLWYAHAVMWAVFIAYLPFGKLKHIITTPLNLILSADSKKP